jgi:tripartite-type tricarboxylate transporter receptor subunit TctC
VVTGARRSPSLTDVPTLAEAGAPNQESEIILGLLAPSGTPREIIDRLQQEIVRVLAMAQIHERLAALGFEPIGSSPEVFADRIRTEIEKWAKVIHAAGLAPQ